MVVSVRGKPVSAAGIELVAEALLVSAGHQAGAGGRAIWPRHVTVGERTPAAASASTFGVGMSLHP